MGERVASLFVNVLVIGGSSFVGRAAVRALVDRGHAVTTFNRGRTPSDTPTSVVRLFGDRREDLSALAGLSFDATVDAIAYQRRDVELLFDALGDRAGYYQQISTVAAYEPPSFEGANESAPLLQLGEIDPNAPVTSETYGVLKAECERTGRELFGLSSGYLRPTYIIGSHDHTLRFPYWVARLSRGGRVAFPGPRHLPFQWIDARDLGEFSARLVEGRVSGAFNVLGPSPSVSFGEMLEVVASRVAPPGTTLVEIDSARLSDPEWRQRFPLWSGPLAETLMTLDNSAALAQGLLLRPLEESVDDTAAWFADTEWPERWLSDDGGLLD